MAKFKEANMYYEKAISLQQDYANAYFNLSMLLLLQKDYQKGFELYKYRYHDLKKDKNIHLVHKDTLPDKQTDFKNAKLFINYEQGLGDSIQFIRFLPEFLKKNATVQCRIHTTIFIETL